MKAETPFGDEFKNIRGRLKRVLNLDFTSASGMESGLSISDFE